MVTINRYYNQKHESSELQVKQSKILGKYTLLILLCRKVSLPPFHEFLLKTVLCTFDVFNKANLHV